MSPVRNTSKRRASRCTTGILPLSGENAGALNFEGRLDLNFQLIMSVAPHVQRYVEQPETFGLTIDGKHRRYTPDGLAYTSFGQIYFEVKPKRILARCPDLHGRLAAIKAECKRRGAGFEIMTESQILSGCLLENSTAVWSASQDIETRDVQRACRSLRSVALPARMRDLVDIFGRDRWRVVKALIGLRYLSTDLSQPFSEDTLIRRGGRDW